MRRRRLGRVPGAMNVLVMSPLLPLLLDALRADPVVVRRARRLQIDRAGLATARRTSAAPARTRRPAASRVGAISRPQPTGTSMNRWSASAPISSARSSSARQLGDVVLGDRRVDLDRHAFVAQVAATRGAPARAIRACPRKRRGSSGSAPSRLIATREKPVSAIFAATARSPACRWSPAPCGSRSRRRTRRCRTGPGGTAARRPTARTPAWPPRRSDRSASNARAVVSSVGPSVRCGTARQWRQLRLHALVVSQNTRRRDGGHDRASTGRTRMASATTRSTASSV